MLILFSFADRNTCYRLRSDSAKNRDALPQWAQKMISLYESRALAGIMASGIADGVTGLCAGGNGQNLSSRMPCRRCGLPCFG